MGNGRSFRPGQDRESVYLEGYRAGYKQGVSESAEFYKKLIRELKEAAFREYATLRDVRDVFAKYEDEEEGGQ